MPTARLAWSKTMSRRIFFFLHESCRLEDVVIVVAPHGASGHDIADAGFGGIFPVGDGADGDVAVGDDAEEMIVLADGQGADVVVFHFLGGLLERCLRVDVFEVFGHDVSEQHGVFPFGCGSVAVKKHANFTPIRSFSTMLLHLFGMHPLGSILAGTAMACEVILAAASTQFFFGRVIDAHPWSMLILQPLVIVVFLFAQLVVLVAVMSVYVVIRTWPRRHDFDRITSGKCLHCGYDLRSSGHICPECGRSTSWRPNTFRRVSP